MCIESISQWWNPLPFILFIIHLWHIMFIYFVLFFFFNCRSCGGTRFERTSMLKVLQDIIWKLLFVLFFYITSVYISSILNHMHRALSFRRESFEPSQTSAQREHNFRDNRIWKLDHFQTARIVFFHLNWRVILCYMIDELLYSRAMYA